MDTHQRNKIRAIIAQEIAETIVTIRNLEESSKPVAPDNAIGRLSRMEIINAKGVSEAALGTASRKLGKLRIALANIDQPAFGTCYECGEAIPIGRILLMPETTMCVSCAEEFGS